MYIYTALKTVHIYIPELECVLESWCDPVLFHLFPTTGGRGTVCCPPVPKFPSAGGVEWTLWWAECVREWKGFIGMEIIPESCELCRDEWC